MRKEFLIAAAVMFPLAVFAGSDTPDTPTTSTVQESFNSLDTNHDGYISPQEAKANTKLSDQWNTADANGDGKIEESEFSAFEAGTAPTYTPEENTDEPSIGAEPTK
jgi:Ca2+-binding EF-hand superfamily protein